jgi:hypothetical protein
MSIVIWKEDEIARILVMDEERTALSLLEMTTLSKQPTDRCIGCSQQFLS